MTIEEMRKKKIELGYNYETIAKLSGLPISTVQKILGGVTKAPRRQSLLALERALTEEPGGQAYSAAQAGVGEQAAVYATDASKPDDSGQDVVRESAAAYHTMPSQGIRIHTLDTTQSQKDNPFLSGIHTVRALGAAAQQEIAYMRKLTQDPRQGTYTAADRAAFPKERRTELIDGVIYDMASPSWKHQTIVSKMYQLVQSQIEKEGCRCLCFLAPFDVALDGDQWTRVQPDFMVLCHTVTGGSNYINGAPDLVVEVLSPSTRRKDQQVKTRKYADAGVREYWMIDPDKETVTILYMNDQAPQTVGTPLAWQDQWNQKNKQDRKEKQDQKEETQTTDDAASAQEVGNHPYAAIYGFHDKIPMGICEDGFALDFSSITKVLQRTQAWGLIQPADPAPAP